MKIYKKLLSVLLIATMLLGAGIFVSAQDDESNPPTEADIRQSYEKVVDFAAANAIPLDLSLETFIAEFEASNWSELSEYEHSYYSVLAKRQVTFVPFSGGGDWYFNTGTTLPRAANYAKYNLLNTVKAGDVIYEARGFYGLTGHTAIVEGTYYSSEFQQYYIRIVEANSSGVERGVLDDTRVDVREVSVLRVSGATNAMALNAANFCIGQLGKNYMIDFQKDTGENEADWYCSELVWAGYYRQGIDIETSNFFNEPGVTPRDIYNCSRVYNVNFR